MFDYVTIHTVDDYGIERPTMVRVVSMDEFVEEYAPLDEDVSACVPD